MSIVPRSAVLLVIAAAIALLPASERETRAASAEATARRMLAESGVRGGLVVHLGCGDGNLAAALRASDAYRVHGLARDEAALARARAAVRATGRYGPVSVDRLRGKTLPYANNLVNLLVADDLAGVPMPEVMRVLAPGGVALVGGTRTVKPRPGTIDEWTHWLHGPDGNAVARDTTVGLPRRLQWTAGPRWIKHHNATISFSAMVSANGRLFMILDDTPPGLFGLPRKWALLARDAFNGTLLWRRPLEAWGWQAWVGKGMSGSRFDQTTDLQRHLVAVGDSVYVPLAEGAPLSRLDAATGEVLHTYADTERVSEVLVHNGRLIVSVHQEAKDAEAKHLAKGIRALEADSGDLLWKADGIAGLVGKTNALAPYTSLYLTAMGDRLFYAERDAIVCRDLATGKEVWRVARPPRGDTLSKYASLYLPDLCTLVASGDVLLVAQTKAINRIPWNDPVPATLVALSAATGDVQWEASCGNWSCGSPADVFVSDGTVWVHAPKGYALHGLDLATGRTVRTFPTAKAMDGPHHHRCYRNKATATYILTGRRGVEFLSLDSGANRLHHWVRGACRYGVLPANGLLYAPPNPCMCYATANVNGFLALASDGQTVPETPAAVRLEKGPAFGQTPSAEAPAPWPTYRHDARRTGATDGAVPAGLTEAWAVRVGGDPSSVTVAAGKVFVASAREHAVCALDAATGREVWRYTVGGPVDSPPTFHGGTVLVGSADGCVYALRAADGALVWRFQAAPADVRVSAFGDLASPWSVHGSVLLEDGTAYVTAGRSSFLDGGIHLYALDPATGRVKQHAVRYSPDSETGEASFNPTLRYDMPPDRPGALSDILVSDGRYLHMRHTRIDPADLDKDFARTMTEARKQAFLKAKQSGKVLDFGPQMTSTAGLLDGSWFNQTFWSFANTSHGRLLVCDAERTYGVRAYGGSPHRHTRSKFVAGSSKHRLFADDRKAGKQQWAVTVPMRVRAMVAADDALVVAGTPDTVPTDDPWAGYEGRLGGLLWIVAKADGAKRTEVRLASPPVWDGMAVADGRLYLATADGRVRCLGAE